MGNVALTNGVGATAGVQLWTTVPINDTSDFDQTCQYRFKYSESNTEYTHVTGVTEPSTSAPYYYSSSVSPKALIYVDHENVASFVTSTNKGIFTDTSGDVTFHVTEMEKTCGQLAGASPVSSPRYQYSFMPAYSTGNYTMAFQLDTTTGNIIVDEANNQILSGSSVQWIQASSPLNMNSLSFASAGQAPYGNLVTLPYVSGESDPMVCITDSTGKIGCAVAYAQPIVPSGGVLSIPWTNLVTPSFPSH